ncbi:hypothetical protein [Lacicoccus qingdaonensis]|uniref:Uncharacterized protein n=1 Tax=Lacicoccus qingdaonensis TaxID=576118 RepID=A0A1G9D166_9BACL|nr:hypothetical protein [Salinicoccus qingdaonensis]SDK57661.1 hypothetical protein SAMN05216216_10512 [Salinicoccus qingdaonensis]
MLTEVLYTILLISIALFLVSGMMTILQYGGYFQKHKQRYIKYFIIFAGTTIVLMGVLVVISL